MLRWVLSLGMLLLSSAATAADAAAPRDPYKFFFNDTWGNYQEELANARSQGKQGVLVFFEMDECPFCHYMKQNVLNQPQVQEYYRERFLSFAVDIEGDLEVTNFQGKATRQKDFAFKEFRVRATPVIAFFDLQGNLVHRHTGKTAGVEEFMLMGEYVAGGAYKQMPFARYKREKRAPSTP